MPTTKRRSNLLSFWLFVALFKFGAVLHFALLSWLGIKIMDTWAVGMLIGASSLVQLLLDVPTGYLIDRFGSLTMLRLGTLVFIAGALVLVSGLTLQTFLLTLAFSTLGWLAFAPGTNAYVLSSASTATGGASMGLYHSVAALGVVLSAVALVFSVRMSVPSIGILIGTVLMLAFILLTFARPPKSSGLGLGQATRPSHRYYIHRHFVHQLIKRIRQLRPAFAVLAAQYFISSIFYASIWFVLPLLLASQAGSPMLGLGLSGFDLSVVVLGSFLGRLADRKKRTRLVFGGLLLFAIMATLTGFSLNAWFLVFGFLATAGDELSEVSLWSWINSLDARHDQDGSLTAIVVLFGDLGYAVGPVIAGFLYGIVGPAATIALCAIPIFGLWLGFAFLNARRTEGHAFDVPGGMRERLYRFRHKG